MKIPDLLDFGLARAPQRICIAQDGRQFTFAEVDRRAAQAAAAMTDAGIRAGDRVMLLAMNEIEFLELQIACQRIGAAFVPVNFRLAQPEVAAIVAGCEPALLIYGKELAELAASSTVARQWCLGEEGANSYAAVLEHAAPTQGRYVLEAQAIAQIMYTSGTTGKAKGAMISNAALFSRIATLAAGFKPAEGDVFMQPLPLFHLASLVSFAYTAMGAAVVNLKSFEPAAALDVIAKHGVTHTLMVPTIVQALAAAQRARKADLSSLRLIMYGASPFNPNHLATAMADLGCDFLQFYGMTEVGIAVCLGPEDHDPQRNVKRLSAAGRDLPFYRTAIVRANGSNAAIGEVGEITIESPGLLDGYWNNPDAIREALRDSRLHTGDAGYRDADGYLFITDRIKDMIKTGGENVYCKEVESVLLDHPQVADAAIIGLPDDRWGQRVHALIVPKPGDSIDDDALDAWCKARLAGYKRPKSYETIAALPRNAVGKILKHVLRAERADATTNT